MGSLSRALQRRRGIRKNSEQMTRIVGEGYQTLRPTKGWVLISGKRLRAQERMAQLLDHVLPPSRKKAPKQYRKPAPVPPSITTRQQRRYAARKGL